MDKEFIIKIKKLREEGKSYGQIAVEMLITKSQANYWSKIDLEKYEKKKDSIFNYEQKICNLAKNCKNIHQILKILGKSSTTENYECIRKVLNKYNIDTPHLEIHEHVVSIPINAKKNISVYLVNGSSVRSHALKKRIITEGLKENKCEMCGLSEWQGHDIPLQLHHINGNKKDNRLENLQILCPNCHALTDNYCGKKLKKETNKCRICGKDICKTSTYCFDCYLSYVRRKKTEYINNNGIECKYPTSEELLYSFKELGSFRSVGKAYGVSDKTIVKWCHKHHLPYKALEMRKYLRDYFNCDFHWGFTSGNANALMSYQKKRFKKICLLDENENIEKIYYSNNEIINDGFDDREVKKVCKGKAKTHRKRRFKFLE